MAPSPEALERAWSPPAFHDHGVQRLAGNDSETSPFSMSHPQRSPCRRRRSESSKPLMPSTRRA